MVCSKCKTLFNKLIHIRLVTFVAIFFGISLLFGQISHFFPEEAWIVDTGIDLSTSFNIILYGIILGPLVETLLFQTLIIFIVCKVIKKDKFNFYPAILLSAIAFSLNHSYNYYYMIYTFIIGIIYALAYYILRYRKENATLIVFVIHALDNLVSFSTEPF